MYLKLSIDAHFYSSVYRVPQHTLDEVCELLQDALAHADAFEERVNAEVLVVRAFERRRVSNRREVKY